MKMPARDKPKHKFMKAQTHFSKILIKAETVKEIVHTKNENVVVIPNPYAVHFSVEHIR